MTSIKTNSSVLPFTNPISVKALNNFQEKTVADLVSITKVLNQTILPTLESLPSNIEISPVANGLQGKTIYLDDEDTSVFFDSVNTRPKTIKEVIQDVRLSITAIEQSIQELESNAGVLTNEAKARIGNNVFNTGQASSETSLDGKIASLTKAISQLAKDVYGDGEYTFTTDGSGLLDFSVKDQVTNLLVVHSGEWNTDNTLSHAMVGNRKLTTVSGLAPLADLTVTHNASRFPIVQVIDGSTGELVDLSTSLVHDSTDAFTFTNNTGSTLTGSILAVW